MNALLEVCLALGLSRAEGLAAEQAKPEEKPPTAAQAPVDRPAPAETPTLFKTLANMITVGGHVRLRFEYRDPIAFNDPSATPKDEQREDVDLFLERVRLNLTFTLADQVEIFFQPQDQRIWGDEASVLSDEMNLDVHQAFVLVKEIGLPGLSLKVGRQELSYGDQRLVSPLDWSNIGRTWDAVKLRYAPGDWWVEAFYSIIREVLGADDDQDFWAVYFSVVALKDHEFDAYVFGRAFNDNAAVGEPAGDVGNDRDDYTFGLRLKGKLAGFDYTAEVIFQRGEVGDDPVRSWAGAFTLGYTFDIDWKPRIGVEVTHASGDADGADGVLQTFDPLFPFGHAYQGFADVFAFRNGSDLVVKLTLAPSSAVSLHVDFHMFRLDRTSDAWYNFAGAVIRAGVPAARKSVGQELDVHARVSVGKHLKFWGGYSRFLAGAFVADSVGATGINRDMDWVFVQVGVDW